MRSFLLGMTISPRIAYRGKFYLGGDPPEDPQDLLSPDGRAKILNKPARIRVRILERRSMVVVAEVQSDARGLWRVDHLADLEYLVLGLDESGNVNAAVQDWVRPAPMEG